MQEAGSEQQAATEVRRQAIALKRTVAADWYEPDSFIPWQELERDLSELQGGIDLLQSLSDAGPITVDGLADAMGLTEAVLETLRTVLVAPRGAGFVDGRVLPMTMPASPSDIRQSAELVVDLGINRLFTKGVDVRSVVKASLVALDARRRGFRRGHDLDAAVGSVINRAVEYVRDTAGIPVRRAARYEMPDLPSRLEEVLTIEGRPFAAIQSVFQVSSGGRQQRDLSLTYPQLQQNLEERGISLILIVDGGGIQQTPDRVLDALLNSVSACMTLSQARMGHLAEAVIRAARSGRSRMPLKTLIENQLVQEGRIGADLLPAGAEVAMQTLARFIDESPKLALQLDVRRRELIWPAVLQYRLESQSTPPAIALANALGLQGIENAVTGPLSLLRGQMPPDRILPESLHIGTAAASIDANIVRQLSIEARNGGAKIAILIGKDAGLWSQSSEADAQRRKLATSVVAIDIEEVPLIIGAKRPREALVQHVLEQADLTKANPYSQHGVTRQEMFFGRDAELAEIRATLETNSIALLGGRRIGKTSLLSRTVEALQGHRWTPLMVDCQAAGDWSAFSQLMERHGVTTSQIPSASSVMALVDQLAEHARPGRPVLVLDEVDSLLRWDMAHQIDGVSEIVFRAFRAASQEDRVRFVFSGERLVYERLKDPSSPHWNFCRPLALRQLSPQAAADLFERPLEELGVLLEDTERIRSIAWSHSQGHPQIIQHLGSSIVQLLNQQPPQERGRLRVQDIVSVTRTTEFADHYIRTYWGQATNPEKLITCLIASGVDTIAALGVQLQDQVGGQDGLQAALSMLDLYGVIDGLEPPYRLRAGWFPEALRKIGDLGSMIEEMRSRA